MSEIKVVPCANCSFPQGACAVCGEHICQDDGHGNRIPYQHTCKGKSARPVETRPPAPRKMQANPKGEPFHSEIHDEHPFYCAGHGCEPIEQAAPPRPPAHEPQWELKYRADLNPERPVLIQNLEKGFAMWLDEKELEDLAQGKLQVVPLADYVKLRRDESETLTASMQCEECVIVYGKIKPCPQHEHLYSPPLHHCGHARWADTCARCEAEYERLAASVNPQEPAAPAAIEQARPQTPELRDPTLEELDSPSFNAVWKAIKGWDIRRTPSAGYAGATGTDVCTILDALAAAEPAPERTPPQKTEWDESDSPTTARDMAVAIVDMVRGYTIEHASDKGHHSYCYDRATSHIQGLLNRAAAVPEPAAQQESVCQRCLTGIDSNGDGDCVVCHKIPDTALAQFLRTQLRARQAEPAPTPSREQEYRQYLEEICDVFGVARVSLDISPCKVLVHYASDAVKNVKRLLEEAGTK